MPASTANGSVNLSFGLNLTVPPGATNGYTINVGPTDNINYANGTAAGCIDILASKVYTLVASTPQTIDLSSITDVAGTSQVPLRCRELLLYIVDSTLAHSVAVSPGASNAWASAPTCTIYPSAKGHVYRLIADSDSVGAGIGAVIGSTNKSIKFDPGSNNVTLYAIYGMCSAVS